MSILTIALIVGITYIGDELLNGELRMNERILNWLSDRSSAERAHKD